MEGPQSIGAPTSHDRTHDRVSLLEQLVHEDERLERLHLVRQDGLGTQSIPHRQRRVVVPSVDDALWPLASRFAISTSAVEMCSAHRHRGLGISPTHFVRASALSGVSYYSTTE